MVCEAGSERGTGAYSWKEKMQKVDLTTVENFEPTIFIYDNYPGGIGFSESLFQRHEECLARHLRDWAVAVVNSAARPASAL